jgi:uncharacterized SAM-binding protein YcdF (DUF218 family)
MKKIIGNCVRLVLAVFGVLLALYSLMPLGNGGQMSGALPTFLFGVGLALFMILYPFIRDKLGHKGKVLNGILIGCFCAVAAFFVVAFGLMFVGERNTPPRRDSLTVVVLGCKVNGTTPSWTLQRRLDAADAYLSENPTAPCIVTGGQGAGEAVPEGRAMQKYLQEQGVLNNIFVEDQSVNTSENIRNAAAIIEQQDLPKTVVIVTDEFHQFRAQMLARRNGLTPYAVSSESLWFLKFNYMVRESFGIVKDLLVR